VTPPVQWPDPIDDVIGGDLTAALAWAKLVGLAARQHTGWLEGRGLKQARAAAQKGA
jgi:hypothetical protein